MLIQNKKLPNRAAAFLLVLLLLGCAAPKQAAVPTFDGYPKESVEFVAPAGAGSGYDLTIRSVAKCLTETKLVSVPLPVTTKPGGGGSVALAYLAEKAGADDVISVYSPPLCLINLYGATELSYLNNTTPIAKLITDYGCFAVSRDSDYGSITEIMQALKEDPKSIRVGGTSSYGSMDHVQFLKIAKAAGVSRLNEIEYFGFEDGSAAAQLMGGHLDVISCGISDVVGLVENGELRVLAITADKRVGKGIVAEMPTCIEQGIPASFYNWRGLFGPKDMPDYALAFWQNTLEQMVKTPQWDKICEEYGWDMDYMNQTDFIAFLKEVNEEYAELLRDVNLLKRS